MGFDEPVNSGCFFVFAEATLTCTAIHNCPRVILLVQPDICIRQEPDHREREAKVASLVEGNVLLHVCGVL